MLSPVEPWVPGGVQADRGIWETEGPGEPALTLPHSSPAEASQQMAKLSEVLALRMENYEQQQREVAQLQGQVTKLQRCCRSVSRDICGASSSCHSPLESTPPSLCPHPRRLSSEASLLCQSQSWRRHQGASHPVPLSQVGG